MIIVLLPPLFACPTSFSRVDPLLTSSRFTGAIHPHIAISDSSPPWENPQYNRERFGTFETIMARSLSEDTQHFKAGYFEQVAAILHTHNHPIVLLEESAVRWMGQRVSNAEV